MAWWLFRHPPVIESDCLCVIIDDAGTHIIDKNYRDIGVKEGWLVRTGYYTNAFNRLVWTYSIRP